MRNRLTKDLTGAERLTYRSERFPRFHQRAWFARQGPDPALFDQVPIGAL
jgi:hypothetical protein